MPSDLDLLKKIKEKEELANEELSAETKRLKEAYEQTVKKAQADLNASIKKMDEELDKKRSQEANRLKKQEEKNLSEARASAARLSLELTEKDASRIFAETVKKYLEG